MQRAEREKERANGGIMRERERKREKEGKRERERERERESEREKHGTTRNAGAFMHAWRYHPKGGDTTQ